MTSRMLYPLELVESLTADGYDCVIAVTNDALSLTGALTCLEVAVRGHRSIDKSVDSAATFIPCAAVAGKRLVS